jgi:predicted alpha/beta-hydrolase family hydrolase
MTDLLWTRPDGPEIATMILAHGSGTPMDSPFLERLTAALVTEGIAVARFEFAYMARRRNDGKKLLPSAAEKLVGEYRTAIRHVLNEDTVAVPLILAGKSLGGRVAVMTGATDLTAADLGPVSGVVCFGYPLHPTGEPEKLRLAPLTECKLPFLIVQGERDEFGNRAEFDAVDLKPSPDIVWLEDGSHDFGPRGQSGATLKGNIAIAAKAAADFARTLAAQLPSQGLVGDADFEDDE